MQERHRKWLVYNLASPYGLALIAYAFFLANCLIPPTFYSHVVGEPDLMFLNAPTIFFYSLCVLGFVGGVWLTGWLFPTSYRGDRGSDTRYSITSLVLPVLLCTAYAAVALVKLLQQNATILIWLLAQQGSNIKSADSLEGGSNSTLPTLLLIACIWWAWWRYSGYDLPKRERWIMRTVLLMGMVLVIAGATVVLSRALLMLFISGIAILYVVNKSVRSDAGLGAMLQRGAMILTALALFFFAFSFLRGTASWEGQFAGLFAYTGASYNRLAAVVSGQLHYPYGGRGVYLSSFVSYSHLLNSVIPLNRIYGWPEYVDVWNSEFGAVTRAGLSDGAIWSGAFGYIFSDLGWFSPLFIFGYGLLYGLLWRALLRGWVLGCVLYPAFGFCVIFWFGSNFLLDSEMMSLLVAALGLALYERLLTKRHRRGLKAAGAAGCAKTT